MESAFSPEIVSGDWVSADGLDIPEPPPEVAEPVLPRVGPEITAPTRIVTVEPVYPEAARHARIEGVVVLSLIIGPSGTVDSIEVLRGLPMGLTEAAVEAASQWVFEPSTYRGRPTAVQYNLTVRFTLN
jgi:protein TonB